jgi:uncharacterized membrane protein YtjA (UPF0391 family)
VPGDPLTEKQSELAGRSGDRLPPDRALPYKEKTMLSWALTFLVLALVAALLGFGGLAAGFASIAKILFVVFLVLFLVSLIGGAVGRPPVV